MGLATGKYTLEDALKGKGPLVRVTIEKTKVAPYWLNESIDLYLPVNGVWHQLSEWPPIPTETPLQSGSGDTSATELPQEIMALPPDERDAIQFIWPLKGGVRRQQVDDNFSWSENKSVSVLNSLIEKGLVRPDGEGKGRIYKPKE